MEFNLRFSDKHLYISNPITKTPVPTTTNPTTLSPPRFKTTSTKKQIPTASHSSKVRHNFVSIKSPKISRHQASNSETQEPTTTYPTTLYQLYLNPHNH
jgi:hypothetical protein